MNKLDIINHIIDASHSKTQPNHYDIGGSSSHTIVEYLLPWICSFSLGMIPPIFIHFIGEKPPMNSTIGVGEFWNRGELLWVWVSLCGVSIGDALRASYILTLSVRCLIFATFLIGISCCLSYVMCFYDKNVYVWWLNIICMLAIFVLAIFTALTYINSIKKD